MVTNSPILPRHRVIVAVDIEGSTQRTNPAKARLRDLMYDLIEEALWASGVSEEYRDQSIDRGDGVIVLIRPVDQVPKTTLFTNMMPQLGDLLAAHNGHQSGRRLRLRVAIHAGEVHYDHRGVYGEDIDITCRLLDAPELKTKLRRTTAPMALVVSDHVYQSVVRQGYEGINPQAFEPLVTVSVGTHSHNGWVSTPSKSSERPWAFHPVTGDVRTDRLLHLAGQELDTRATVKALDPATVVEQIFHAERNELPGTG